MTGLREKTFVSLVACFATSTLLASPQAARVQPAAAPTQVGDFALLDQNGVFHQLSRTRYRKAVVLMAYDAACPGEGMTGEIEASALYAGMGVGRITGVEPVAEVFARLAAAMPR